MVPANQEQNFNVPPAPPNSVHETKSALTMPPFPPNMVPNLSVDTNAAALRNPLQASQLQLVELH